MIVTENNNTMDRKGAPPQSATTQPPVQPPPAYPRAHESLLPNYVPNSPVPLQLGGSPHKRALKRFFKAALVAFGIWALFGIITRSIIRISIHSGHSHRWDLGDANGPRKSDGSIVSCLDGYAWMHDKEHPPRRLDSNTWEVTRAFNLPLDSDELYFIASGSHSHGNIEFVAVDSDKEVAVVQMKATYDYGELMEASKVCLLTHHDRKHGLGIYTPEKRWTDWPSHRLDWTVKVSIPAGSDLAALSTRMPIFPHQVNGKGLNFGVLTLSTTNAAIHLDTVHAATTTAMTTNAGVSGSVNGSTTVINTTNGKITGTFNATGSLNLKTTNGVILATVGLTYLDGANSPATAVLETTNGKIDGSVSLFNAPASKDQASFLVTAHTTNSQLALGINEMPTDSKLSVIGRTRNGRATAQIHPAFEGSFYAKTTNSRVTLNTLQAKDPRGDDRKRTLENVFWDKRRTQVSGSVHWGSNSEMKQSMVTLESTNSDIELIL